MDKFDQHTDGTSNYKNYSVFLTIVVLTFAVGLTSWTAVVYTKQQDTHNDLQSAYKNLEVMRVKLEVLEERWNLSMHSQLLQVFSWRV